MISTGRHWVLAFCLLAGAADAATGVLLVAAPAATLGLMGIPQVPDDAVFLRWIGVFVGSVGLMMLVPFLRPAGRREALLEAALCFTSIARACVALFVTAAIIRGSLAPQWASVAATDAVVAGIQVLILRGGWLRA